MSLYELIDKGVGSFPPAWSKLKVKELNGTTVKATHLRDNELPTGSPSLNDTLIYNGTEWEYSSGGGGGGMIAGDFNVYWDNVNGSDVNSGLDYDNPIRTWTRLLEITSPVSYERVVINMYLDVIEPEIYKPNITIETNGPLGDIYTVNYNLISPLSREIHFKTCEETLFPFGTATGDISAVEVNNGAGNNDLVMFRSIDNFSATVPAESQICKVIDDQGLTQWFAIATDEIEYGGTRLYLIGNQNNLEIQGTCTIKFYGYLNVSISSFAVFDPNPLGQSNIAVFTPNQIISFSQMTHIIRDIVDSGEYMAFNHTACYINLFGEPNVNVNALQCYINFDDVLLNNPYKTQNTFVSSQCYLYMDGVDVSLDYCVLNEYSSFRGSNISVGTNCLFQGVCDYCQILSVGEYFNVGRLDLSQSSLQTYQIQQQWTHVGANLRLPSIISEKSNIQCKNHEFATFGVPTCPADINGGTWALIDYPYQYALGLYGSDYKAHNLNFSNNFADPITYIIIESTQSDIKLAGRFTGYMAASALPLFNLSINSRMSINDINGLTFDSSDNIFNLSSGSELVLNTTGLSNTGAGSELQVGATAAGGFIPTWSVASWYTNSNYQLCKVVTL